jgi:hypothetical protein
MVNAPLFAKTTTFAASSAVLARLPARDAGWLRQAAAPQATTATDRVRWASACSQGLKPLAVTQQQFTALHAAEAATYAGLAADQQTTQAINRVGSLAHPGTSHGQLGHLPWPRSRRLANQGP